MMRTGQLVLLLCSLIPAAHSAIDEETEIGFLIQAVADSGCQFDRNGTRHSAQEAAEHLALKYARGQRYAVSAEEFIENLASKSSWSGEPYLMICEEETTPAGDWLVNTLDVKRGSHGLPEEASPGR